MDVNNKEKQPREIGYFVESINTST